MPIAIMPSKKCMKSAKPQGDEREEPAEGPHASRTCPLRTAMSVGSGGWEGRVRPGHDHGWVVARVRPAVRRMLRGEWLVSAVTAKG